MIKWDKDAFKINTFSLDVATEVENVYFLNYEGDILKYQLIIDENEGRVSVSADTQHPFGSDSLYEFYVPCKLIVLNSGDTGSYRRFHFSFYRTIEENKKTLSLTVAGRQSDKELVVWPYLQN